MVAGRFLILLDLLDPRFDSPSTPIFFTEIKKKTAQKRLEQGRARHARIVDRERAGAGAIVKKDRRKKQTEAIERSYVPVANCQSAGK